MIKKIYCSLFAKKSYFCILKIDVRKRTIRKYRNAIGNTTINGFGVQIPVVTAKSRNIEKQALTIPLSNARLKV